MSIKINSRPNPLRITLPLAILLVLLLQTGPVTARSSSTSAMAPPQAHLTPAIVYVTSDWHIHELALKGTWQDRDLTAAAGAPHIFEFAEPVPYLRSDGVSMVVYQGTDSHIYALYLELVQQGSTWQELWHCADLTAITGAPSVNFGVAGYVRSDGISAVVFIDDSGHIHELRLEGVWIWADLTVISGAPASDTWPIALARGDGINTIIYGHANHIYELRLEGGWKWADLTTLSGAPDAINPGSAYVRSDGSPVVLFKTVDGHIHEIRLVTGWTWSDLTAASGAPEINPMDSPRGYVRSDGINAVVYAAFYAGSNHILELRLDNGWKYYELTSVPNAVPGTGPVGYVRADGISAVVYAGMDKHILEIWLGSTWHWADLTSLAGAPVLDQYQFSRPYNRSSMAKVYLPLIMR